MIAATVGGISVAEEMEAKEEKDAEPKQEEDITEKAQYLLKYGIIGLLLLAVISAAGLYLFTHSHNYMTVYDAHVASQMVGVKARADGKITEFAVEDGAHVEAGDVIARVSVNITEEQIKQLEQTVELSQRNLEQLKRGQTVTVPAASSYNPASQQQVAQAAARMQRMNELFEMGAISAVKRDEAVADYQAAQAAASSAPRASVQTTTRPTDPKIIEQAELQLKQAQAALANAKQDVQATEILAPVAGTVYYTDVQADSDVKAGQTIVRIGDSANVWIEARLTPEQTDKVRLGQFASYEIEGQKLQGAVEDIRKPEPASQDDVENLSGNTADTEAGSSEAENESNDMTVVRITLPQEQSQAVRPGAKAVVKLALGS